MDVVQACLSTINVTTVDVVPMLVTPVSVLVRSDKAYRVDPVEVVQACFKTRIVLKFSSGNCRSYAMLLDSCFSDEKIR